MEWLVGIVWVGILLLILHHFLYQWLAKCRREEMEDVFQRQEQAERTAAQEQQAIHTVIHGGFWNDHGQWQSVDMGRFAMESPYASVKDEFHRQEKRAREQTESMRQARPSSKWLQHHKEQEMKQQALWCLTHRSVDTCPPFCDSNKMSNSFV